jgi:hypothetical protein
MTDRELLELAAKAAGIKALRDPDGVLRDCTGSHPAMNIFGAKTWNPLTDDGDALRLAVKIGINIQCLRAEGYDKTTAVQCQVEGYIVNVGIDEGCNGDSDAAARHAIVWAAAEIGKAMP